jgi:hypothetical protein
MPLGCYGGEVALFCIQLLMNPLLLITDDFILLLHFNVWHLVIVIEPIQISKDVLA